MAQGTGHGMKHSPPDTSTPSEFTARVLRMAWWPEKFWMKFPSGNFHILILSGEAEANENLYRIDQRVSRMASLQHNYTHSVGWSAIERTLFLWLVSTAFVLPAARSHSRIVESWLPVTTCTPAGPCDSLSNMHVRSYLRVGSLGRNISYCVSVASQGVYACLCAHIPHL